MGYMHIENLYRDRTILLFRECFAMEKVHGTSTHIRFRRGANVIDIASGESKSTYSVEYFSGGAKHETFKAIFDEADLLARHAQHHYDELVVYGEGYGGKMQGMSLAYGSELRFIAFDVQIDGKWLVVPSAEMICQNLGLEFVPYRVVSTDLESLDAERDRPSEVAVRRGMGESHTREGVVLRPLVELTRNNDTRVICKHKHPKFAETATERGLSEEELQVLQDADAIAQEWATENRLRNILSHLPPEEIEIEATGKIVKLMIEDVEREGAGEIVKSLAARKAIGRRAAKLFKALLVERLREAA